MVTKHMVKVHSQKSLHDAYNYIYINNLVFFISVKYPDTNVYPLKLKTLSQYFYCKFLILTVAIFLDFIILYIYFILYMFKVTQV